MRITSGSMPHFVTGDASVCRKRNPLNYNIESKHISDLGSKTPILLPSLIPFPSWTGTKTPMIPRLYRLFAVSVPELGGNEKANDFKGFRFRPLFRSQTRREFPLPASRREAKFDGNENANVFKTLSTQHRSRSRVRRERKSQ